MLPSKQRIMAALGERASTHAAIRPVVRRPRIFSRARLAARPVARHPQWCGRAPPGAADARTNGWRCRRREPFTPHLTLARFRERMSRGSLGGNCRYSGLGGPQPDRSCNLVRKPPLAGRPDLSPTGGGASATVPSPPSSCSDGRVSAGLDPVRVPAGPPPSRHRSAAGRQRQRRRRQSAADDDEKDRRQRDGARRGQRASRACSWPGRSIRARRVPRLRASRRCSATSIRYGSGSAAERAWRRPAACFRFSRRRRRRSRRWCFWCSSGGRATSRSDRSPAR